MKPSQWIAPWLSGTLLAGSVTCPYLAWIAFLPLLWALEKTQSLRMGFYLTYCASLPIWVMAYGGAFHLQPTLIALLILALGLGYGLVGLGVVFFREKMQTAWAFALLWLACETLNALGNFGSWSNPISIGYAQADSPLLKAAFWSGVHGVAWLVLVFNGCVYQGVRTRKIQPMLLGLGLLVVATCLPQALSQTKKASVQKQLRLAVVQGAIAPEEHRKAYLLPETRRNLIKRYRKLSKYAAQMHAQLILWPESSIPADASDPQVYADILAGFENLPPVLAGGYHRTALSKRLYNSAFLWDTHGLSVAYNKRVPAPFFESDILAAKAQGLPKVAGFSLGIQICWDTLSEQLSRELTPQSDLLVMLTNTTFAQGTPIPKLHRDVSRFRAVSTGRYVIHASQSGPSAAYDPLGNTLTEMLPGQNVSLMAISGQKIWTPFVAFGDMFGLGSLAMLLILLGESLFRSQKRPPTGVRMKCCGCLCQCRSVCRYALFFVSLCVAPRAFVLGCFGRTKNRPSRAGVCPGIQFGFHCSGRQRQCIGPFPDVSTVLAHPDERHSDRVLRPQPLGHFAHPFSHPRPPDEPPKSLRLRSHCPGGGICLGMDTVHWPHAGQYFESRHDTRPTQTRRPSTLPVLPGFGHSLFADGTLVAPYEPEVDVALHGNH